MQLLSNAKAMRWDWDGWIMGIFGALTSGLASGLTGLGVGVSRTQAIWLFVIPTGWSLGKYLQTKPTPDKLQAALETASIEQAKSVAQAVKAADAVQDAKDAAPKP